MVLNYRTPSETIRAVSALTAAHAAIHTIVVDNASGDGSAEQLVQALPNSQIVVADSNGGFAAGCNLGIRAALDAGARRVFLLNSDAIVEPQVVCALEAALDTHNDLGIVAPLIVSGSEPEVIESAGVEYSALTGRMTHIASGYARRRARLLAMARVEAVSGCAMLIRREVFEAIGLLAEEYFYGFEDLEFCLRAGARGFGIAVVSTTAVRHTGQASIGRASPRRLYFGVRNHLLMARGFGPQAWPIRTARATAIIGWTTVYAIGRSGAPATAGLRAIYRGVRDHWRGRYGADEP